ncbi:hypothetical protein PIB30_079683 [Stylosanthes scabra]|uniref:Uncharacterized protein n=1 Tax=Stylosanthes scabra TaxID=79078 RepID=A0ABU6UTW3_9FABA|nr:hypothetical protein [Stylosanthes scabra]
MRQSELRCGRYGRRKVAVNSARIGSEATLESTLSPFSLLFSTMKEQMSCIVPIAVATLKWHRSSADCAVLVNRRFRVYKFDRSIM